MLNGQNNQSQSKNVLKSPIVQKFTIIEDEEKC